MDDVVLIATSEKDMQDLLNTTERTSKRYHIEFGRAKSQALKIGRNNLKPAFKLGDMPIDNTTTYKYLGEVFNDRENLTDHIKQLEGKAEAAYQTILTIAEDRHFKQIKMGLIWKLIETCIIPIIVYGAETWTPNKQEMKKLNSMLDNILKRTLMVPTSTPREALYIETGLLDIETILDKKRLNMAARVKREKPDLVEVVLKRDIEGGWNQSTKRVRDKYNMNNEELTGSKYKTKRVIDNKVEQAFREKIEISANQKSKIRYIMQGKQGWEVGKREEYLESLTRSEVETIFRARSRMLQVKENYKGAFSGTVCRACGNETETQKHVLNECPKIHVTESSKVNINDIFNKDPKILKEVAEKTKEALKKLMECNFDISVPAPTSSGRVNRRPGKRTQ